MNSHSEMNFKNFSDSTTARTPDMDTVLSNNALNFSKH